GCSPATRRTVTGAAPNRTGLPSWEAVSRRRWPMLDDVDNTLAKLLEKGFGAPLPFDLSFAVPDKSFKLVGNRTTVNFYLYDIREDRELRSAEPTLTRKSDGTVEKAYPPLRVRVSYCITAWSPIPPGSTVEPVSEEHKWLGQVLQLLARFPLLPADVLQGA